MGKRIIIFDEACNLCNKLIDFIITRDVQRIFYFADKDGAAARKLKDSAHLPKDISEKTVLFFKGDTFYTRSRAVLEIMKDLGFPWFFVYAFIIVPLPIRDLVYEVIRKNRFKIFGATPVCRVRAETRREIFCNGL